MNPGIDLKGKRVLIVGLARTGIASALFCASRGAHVTATEERTASQLGDVVEKLRAAGVTVELGGHLPDTFTRQDLLVVSPGVPFNLPHLAAARAAGIPVWSEIELASRFLSGRLVAVTGSNGKTTTTSLIAHILETAGIPTLIGGNIGTPLVSRVETSSDRTVTVAEVSSFQLENIHQFRPDIAVLLNVTPDHLDRHGSMESYARAKARLFENQSNEDAAILNADDPETLKRAPSAPRTFWFSRTRRLEQGAFLREDDIVFRRDALESILLRREDVGLRGDHNIENVLAAAAAAYLAGASPLAIPRGVRTFAGVEHRLEFVAEISHVTWYNDSKATNVDATLKALDAFPGNLIVILGGKDKGSDFSLLRDSLARRARLALLIGASANKIESQISGSVPTEQVGTLDRAVSTARERARSGDVVLLAPACASFDQFENFEHRGRVFKQLVRQLSPTGAP